MHILPNERKDPETTTTTLSIKSIKKSFAAVAGDSLPSLAAKHTHIYVYARVRARIMRKNAAHARDRPFVMRAIVQRIQSTA